MKCIDRRSGWLWTFMPVYYSFTTSRNIAHGFLVCPQHWKRVARFTATARRAYTTMTQHLVVDAFCYRQFAEHAASKSYHGTTFEISVIEFNKIANESFDEAALQPGYAPFCKHLFIPNPTNAKVNVLPINDANVDKLRTAYVARSDKELPVLTRWFPQRLVTVGGNHNLPVAKYLDLILYSREQIRAENAAQGVENSNDEHIPWGIISIKAQDVDYELPMNPITMMRNSLGKAEGGSGIPLDRDDYMASVNYWKDHAVVS